MADVSPRNGSHPEKNVVHQVNATAALGQGSKTQFTCGPLKAESR